MNISLSPNTQKLIEDEMKRGGYASPDDVVRVALESLHTEGAPLEDLDAETLAAIDRAEAESARGEGTPLDDAFAHLRQKHFGR